MTVYKTAAQPAFVWRDGRPTRAQQTQTDVLFGGAVTTAAGSCVCSRRTPGWARKSVRPKPHTPVLAVLGAALAQPQLNHTEQHRGYAALRPGRGANAPTWPDAGSSRSSRQPHRYLRPLPEPTGKIALYHA
jgi:hypothetical protein